MDAPVRRQRAVLTFAIALLVAACGSSPSPAPSSAVQAPSPSAPTGEVGSPVLGDPGTEPLPDTSAEPSPTGSPEPTTGPVATPAPRPAAWSAAHTVLKGSCWDSAGTVDDAGRFHVAASCDGVIRYAESTDGRTWKTVHFSLPARRLDVTPQVTVDGSTLYLAYTRLAVADGGCGDNGLIDVGVYYRTRSLPDGAWTAPVRLGRALDHLQAFRVARGVIHETFTSGGSTVPVSYGVLDHGRYRHSVIPGATGTSLRVGDDGQARIAYTTGSAIRYAVAGHDAAMSIRTIFRSKSMELGTPSMVLGPGDHAYMAWDADRIFETGGCTEPEPPPAPKPGTYFATDASGSWAVRWISKIIAQPSIALDPSSGRVDVVVSYQAGIRQLTRAADGTWSGKLIPGTKDTHVSLLRGIPATGGLLLIGLHEVDEQPPVVVALVQS